MHRRSWFIVLASLLLLSFAIAGVAKTPAVSNGPSPETLQYAQWRLDFVNNELDEDFDLVIEDFLEYDDWTIEDGGTNQGGYNTWANSLDLEPNSDFMTFGYLNDMEDGAFMFCNSDAAVNPSTMAERLITPEFSLAGMNEAVLTFDSRFDNTGGDIAIVEISTESANGPWTDLLAYNAAHEDLQTIDLEDYLDEESVWISFYYTDEGGWLYGWGVDNVLVLGTTIDEGVELLFVDADVSPALVAPGEDVHVSLTVQNTGTDPSAAFEVDWFYNSDAEPAIGDEGDFTWTVDGLDSQETITLEGDFAYDAIATNNIYFIIDTDNVIVEVNEDNNISGPYEVDVEVLPPGALTGEITGNQVHLEWDPIGVPAEFPGFVYDPAENFDYADGVLTFSGSQLDNFAGGHNPEETFSDAVIEIEVTRNSGNIGSSIGIYTRGSSYLSDANFSGYLFLISQNGSYLVAWQDGADMGAYTPAPFWIESDAINTGLGDFNVLTVTMVGDDATFYINGIEVFSFEDDLFDDGHFGFATYDADDDFNNEVVWNTCTISENAEMLAQLNNTEATAPVVTPVDLNLAGFCGNPVTHNANLDFAGFLNTNNELDEFLWYNIYRNDEFITNVADPFYDETLQDFGEYVYYVTAGYTEGESDPTNSVTLFYVNPDAVSGVVTECTDDGALLDNVEVLVDGELYATSNVDGEYSFAIETGTYDLSFVREGYITTHVQDYVIGADAQVLDAILLMPEGTLSTDYIEIQVSFGGDSDSTAFVTVDLENTGCGLLEWEANINILESPWDDEMVMGTTPKEFFADRNYGHGPSVNTMTDGNTFTSGIRNQVGPITESVELDEQWDHLFGFPTTGVSDNLTAGAIVANDRIYVTAGNFGGMFIFNFEGELVDSVEYTTQMTNNGQSWPPLDLSWDGEFFYGGNGNGDVFQFTPDMSTVNLLGNVGHWAIGCAYDWDNGYIYTYEWANNFKRLDIATGQVTNIGAHATVGDVMGLAYMPVDADGYTIWILSQGVDPQNDPAGRVYRYNPESNQFDLNYVELFGGNSSGGLSITQDYRDGMWDVTTLEQAAVDHIDIWEGLVGTPPWLYISEGQDAGTLAPTEEYVMTINVDFTAARLGQVVNLTDGDEGVGELYFEGSVWGGAGPIDIVVIFSENANESSDNLPLEYSLNQNYPNPFNPTTQISYTLARTQDVKLAIYNVMGQEVAVLTDAQMNAGLHTVNFDASTLASGLYFYRLESEAFTSMKKMMLVK